MPIELISPTTTPADVVTCDACPHAEAAHDPISRRYCAATTAVASSRSCICAGQ